MSVQFIQLRNCRSIHVHELDLFVRREAWKIFLFSASAEMPVQVIPCGRGVKEKVREVHTFFQFRHKKGMDEAVLSFEVKSRRDQQSLALISSK